MRRSLILGVLSLISLWLVSADKLSAQNLFMRRANTAGNLTLLVNNNGVLFNRTDSAHEFQGGAGGYWLNQNGQYDTVLFAAGLWFGGLRNMHGVRTPHVEYAYEPNHVGSDFVPGSIIYGGSRIDSSQSARDRYRVYRSSDLVGPAWPVRGAGHYIDDPLTRSNYGPPSTIGDEDLFILYKDSDTAHSADKFSNPFGFEVRTQIGFWKTGLLKDAAIIRNQIINVSQDTIFEPVVAVAVDGDINQPGDDRLKGVSSEVVRADAIFFTAGSKVDPLLGVMQLQGMRGSNRPAAGFNSMRYWDLREDPTTDSERYAFLTERRQDTALSKIGDARVLMSSLSHIPIYPGDTVYYDFCVYAHAATGPALSGADSSSMLGLAEQIYVRYLNGRLSNGVIQPQLVQDIPFPNPASSSISIQLEPGQTTAIVTDVLGRSVAVCTTSSGFAAFDIRSLPVGEYFIKVQGATGIHRFLITR